MSIVLFETWAQRELARSKDSAVDRHEQLDRLTVIIPTYERQAFLLRQTVYWAHSPAKVVIVDGSNEPLSREMRKVIERLPNLRYVHARIGMYERLHLAGQGIRTPYAVMQGDDEFFLKSSLCGAIARLEADPKLVGCNGQSIGFRHMVEHGQGFVELYDAGYAHWRYSVLGENANDRLQYAMSSYNAVTSYAVLRAEVWSASWGDLQAWSSPYAGEIYQAIATYLAGRLETIDEILLLRSGENEPISSTTNFNRKLQFEDWWRLPCYGNERQDFLDRLAEKAMHFAGIGVDEARAMISSALAAYLQLCSRRRRWSWARALRDGCRTGISRGLRRVLPSERVVALKQTIGRVTRRRTRSGATAETLTYGKHADSQVERELSGIERLVGDFYRILAMEQYK